jgi:branched-chain amino acid transport system substrate-binding protein
MSRLRGIARHTSDKFKSYELDICYPASWGEGGIEAKLASLCAESVDAIRSSHNILIISDRRSDRDHVAIPAALALSVCDAAKELLVDQKHMKTAVIMSEDAAWTKPLDVGYEECLPKIGLKVVDHIRFSPDTTDFTPIFNKVEAAKPDVIITGISHVGVQPTVQWKNQQVPIPMFGISSQATNETFGKDTNDAAEGVLYQGVSGPNVAVTPKSVPFAEDFKKRYGNYPSYAGYTAYDEVYYIADAVKRAGSVEADKVVDALEKTDWEGTIGRVQFYGKDDPFTHSIKYGKGLITGLMLQWQGGKQVAVWPKEVAKSDLKFPSFIKLTTN